MIFIDNTYGQQKNICLYHKEIIYIHEYLLIVKQLCVNNIYPSNIHLFKKKSLRLIMFNISTILYNNCLSKFVFLAFPSIT